MILYLAIFGNPGSFAVLGTLKNEECRGFEQQNGDIMGICGRTCEFMVGYPSTSWGMYPSLAVVQDDASPGELEQYNLKLEAGDHRSTVEMGVHRTCLGCGL